MSEAAFWVFFAIVAILVVGGWALMQSRSETVGSVDCRFHSRMGASRARLTIAREGDGAAQVVQVYVRITGGAVGFRMGATDATRLATLLESAAGRFGSP